jgi:hypothetical protein
MKLGPRYMMFGLCLFLIGAGPASEKVSSAWSGSPAAASKATPALAVQEDGRFSVQTSGRRFEFGEGELGISAQDSSWTYRFQGSRGGIRALSISTRPEQTAEGSLQYRHGGGIIERYIVQSRGVEQQFLLSGSYAGGDVLLTGSVQTDLAPEVTSSFEGIAFRRGEDTVLFYSKAKAVDAAGRTALLEERWADGELTIVVPASFLAFARFPVLVDPYIGARATVDAAADLAQNPAVASTGNALFKALAVWSTNATSPQSIRGRIIGPRGNTIIGPISVVDEFSVFNNFYTNPRVAWSSADGVWVVAAVGHDPTAGVNPNFIQINKVNLSGTKTTGGTRQGVALDLRENDVDVACNNSGLCLITWLVDRDGNATLDSVKGVFYTPATNTLGSVFPIIDASATRSHSRVASNGADFYEVNAAGPNFIEGYSVTSGGTVVAVTPSQTFTAAKANPAVSFNSLLSKYLVAWDTGDTIRGTTLSSATPPVASDSDAQIFAGVRNPQITSEDYRGWSAVVFEAPGGSNLVATILVRPDLGSGRFFWPLPDTTGATSVPSAGVAHFFRGLSIVLWEDTLGGSLTDHDIYASEFRTPATEYADFDNNGFASAFVWRPGTNAYFYYANDLLSGSPAANSVQFGTTGDIPVRTDFFGQGLPDLAVFRPSGGVWYIDTNRDGTVDVSIQFGAPGDIPVPGDYDGDGRTDLAVFRPSNGTWYIRLTASEFSASRQFGTSGDIPVPADYDGGFRTSIAVWRPSNGFWYVDTDFDGSVDIQAQFGTAGDIPVPGDYGPSNSSNAPDGFADFAVFRPSTGTWYVSRNRNGVVDLAVQFGTNGDIPVGGVYDSDPNIHSPFAVFRPSNGTWYVDRDNNGTVDFASQFGTAGDFPMQQPSGQYRH